METCLHWETLTRMEFFFVKKPNPKRRLMKKNYKKNMGGYVLSASIMEVILTRFNKLWELQNKEVHYKTTEQQERI